MISVEEIEQEVAQEQAVQDLPAPEPEVIEEEPTAPEAEALDIEDVLSSTSS